MYKFLLFRPVSWSLLIKAPIFINLPASLQAQSAFGHIHKRAGNENESKN